MFTGKHDKCFIVFYFIGGLFWLTVYEVTIYGYFCCSENLQKLGGSAVLISTKNSAVHTASM